MFAEHALLPQKLRVESHGGFDGDGFGLGVNLIDFRLVTL